MRFFSWLLIALTGFVVCRIHNKTNKYTYAILKIPAEVVSNCHCIRSTVWWMQKLCSMQCSTKHQSTNINDIVNRWNESIWLWNLFGWVFGEWSLWGSWHITVLVETTFVCSLLLFVTNGTARVTWLCLIAWSWSLCSFHCCCFRLKDGLELQATMIPSVQNFREIGLDPNYNILCIWIFEYCFLFQK